MFQQVYKLCFILGLLVMVFSCHSNKDTYDRTDNIYGTRVIPSGAAGPVFVVSPVLPYGQPAPQSYKAPPPEVAGQAPTANWGSPPRQAPTAYAPPPAPVMPPVVRPQYYENDQYYVAPKGVGNYDYQ